MFFIPFCKETSKQNVQNLLDSLKKPNTPSCVYINSKGGAFEHFSTLAPAIERLGITTLSGNVASAGVLISLLGHKRYALPESTFYFHEVRAILRPGSEAITVSQYSDYLDYWVEIEALAAYGAGREWLEERLRKLKQAQDWFVAFIARRTGTSSAAILNLMRTKKTLSAEEALRYNIIHQIRRPDEMYSIEKGYGLHAKDPNCVQQYDGYY